MSNRHLPEHVTHVPTVERVRQAHSHVPAEWWKPYGSEGGPGHAPYYQSSDETCYLCALLAEIEMLREELKILKQDKQC